jgi:hypothetical protein
MARLRTRKSLVLLAAALVVFAAFVPGVAALPLVIFTPIGLVVAAVLVTLIRRVAICCDEQPVALLSLLAPRAPPAPVVLA